MGCCATTRITPMFRKVNYFIHHRTAAEKAGGLQTQVFRGYVHRQRRVGVDHLHDDPNVVILRHGFDDGNIGRRVCCDLRGVYRKRNSQG